MPARRTPLEKKLAKALRLLMYHHEDVMRHEGKTDVPCSSTINARIVLNEFATPRGPFSCCCCGKTITRRNRHFTGELVKVCVECRDKVDAYRRSGRVVA